jgi:protein-S-isoprenylcysteine O-methyltransferase Ste14
MLHTYSRHLLFHKFNCWNLTLCLHRSILRPVTTQWESRVIRHPTFFGFCFVIRSDRRQKRTVLILAIEGPPIYAYNAQRALELWWHGGQRVRHPNNDV